MKYLDASTGKRANKIIKGWDDLQKEFGVSGPLDMKQLTESLVNRWEGWQILLLLDEIYKKGLLTKLEDHN